MNDLASVLRLIIEISQQASAAILQVYAGAISTTLKADDSPVTQADLQADYIIRAGLAQHFPGVWVWSEEHTATPPPETPPRFFLVDPLDGTKEFIQRNGEFTINIALIEQGMPVAGVVLAPALDELFYAARGVGAFKARADGSHAHSIHCTTNTAGASLRVLGSRSHGLGALDTWLAALKQPYEFRAMGSSLKFCRIAEGDADVYPRFGPTSQWDTAAGQCVLEQAGGRVVDGAGIPLHYGPQRPLINPDFVAWGHAG